MDYVHLMDCKKVVDDDVLLVNGGLLGFCCGTPTSTSKVISGAGGVGGWIQDFCVHFSPLGTKLGLGPEGLGPGLDNILHFTNSSTPVY